MTVADAPTTISNRAVVDMPFGDLVQLTRAVWDGERKTDTVYVNRRLVTHVTTGRSTTFVHFVGENTIEVTESLQCVAAALQR
jgi:poly-beta-hydroxyalkanoate depolymerase